MQPSPSEVLAVDAVRRAVRSALEPAATWEWPAGLSEETFLLEAQRQRVGLFLVDHEVALPDGVSQSLGHARDGQRLALLKQVHEYRRLDTALGGAGLRWMAFKGVPLAVQSAGSFTARGAGDIDLLVSPDDVPAAHAALVEAGWRLEPGGSYVTPGDSWAWRHSRDTYYELPYRGPHSDIDLHWRLDAAHHALPGFEDLWARREELELAGITIATLSLRDAFRHSSTHAAKDSWHFLRSLVDLHLLAAQPALWAAGHRWLRPVDVVTLRVVSDRIGLPEGLPPAVLDDVRRVPPRRLREAEAAVFVYGPRGRYPGSSMVHLVRAMSRSSRRPSDLWRVAAWAALPAHGLGGLEGHGAAGTVARGLGRRVTAARGQAAGLVRSRRDRQQP